MDQCSLVAVFTDLVYKVSLDVEVVVGGCLSGEEGVPQNGVLQINNVPNETLCVSATRVEYSFKYIHVHILLDIDHNYFFVYDLSQLLSTYPLSPNEPSSNSSLETTIV